MENKINNSMVAIWGGFTILLAVTLTVNAIQSIFGQAVFAYWHLFTLAVSCIMTRASMTEMQWLRMLCKGGDSSGVLSRLADRSGEPFHQSSKL